MIRTLCLQRRLALALTTLLTILSACGGGNGGGGGGRGGSGPQPPGAFSATLRFDGPAQRFIATWGAATGVERYRVSLKRDEAASFAPLSGADDLSSMTLDFSFVVGFTIQWSAATLRIEACNAVGCTAASDFPLLPHLAAALSPKQTLTVPQGNELHVAASADGNTLAIGAPFETGSMGVVRIYTRDGTTWSSQPALVHAPNGEAGDAFGFAVALSADGATLAVGAPQEDGSTTSTVEDENNNAQTAGAAYVFVRNGPTYELQRYLKPIATLDTDIVGDLFGFSVSLAADGATLVVGSPLAEAPLRPTGFNDGAAYVFTRAGSEWTPRAALNGPRTDGNEDDQFGLSVAASADGATVAVGAPFDNGDAQSTFEDPNTNAAAAGAAYIFTTTNRSQWPLQAQLKAPNAQAGDFLGFAVALSGDGNTVAVGATGEDGDATSTLDQSNDNLSAAGAVYVFARSGATWIAPPAYLKASSGFAGADFGASLSLAADGNTLAVGAPSDLSAPPLEGSVFVSVRVGNAWREQIKIVDTPVSQSQEFGTVALAGDGLTLFVGADDTVSPTGIVHVY